MKSLVAILVLVASAAAQQPTPPATQDQTAAPPAHTQPAQQQPESLSTVLTESAQPLNPPNPQPSIATVSLEGVSLTGSISVQEGRGIIGNNGAITAGDKTAHVTLTRGGSLSVCASTKIHLSTDNTISGGGLMIAIDHGALEAHYLPGQYSDVLLTPDLRILISPPGQVDLSLRVNDQGDTCIDNHGDHAPYVLASSLFEGGAYRVQPNQRVLFLRGSLQQVVDNEKESCGCPPPEPRRSPASAARGRPFAPATRLLRRRHRPPQRKTHFLSPKAKDCNRRPRRPALPSFLQEKPTPRSPLRWLTTAKTQLLSHRLQLRRRRLRPRMQPATTRFTPVWSAIPPSLQPVQPQPRNRPAATPYIRALSATRIHRPLRHPRDRPMLNLLSRRQRSVPTASAASSASSSAAHESRRRLGPASTRGLSVKIGGNGCRPSPSAFIPHPVDHSSRAALE